MDGLIVLIVIWVVGRLMRGLISKGSQSKGNQSKNSQGSNRSRQAVESQRQKRQNYEAQMRERLEELRRAKAEEEFWEESEPEPEPEPLYQATPAPVAEAELPPYRRQASPARTLQRQAAQTYAATEQVLEAAPLRTNYELAQSGLGPAIDQGICDHEPYQSFDTVRPQVAPSIRQGAETPLSARHRPNLRLNRKALVQSIVMAEVLAKPRALQPRRPR